MTKGKLFRTRPFYNPRTNEVIKIDSKEYKKLEEKYGEPVKIKSPKHKRKLV